MNAAQALHHREKLLINREAPTRQDTLANLGSILGTTMLNSLSAPAKKLLVIKSDVPDKLWISPDAHLNGNICQTVPINDEVLKAFQHENVIKLGEEIEKKVENEKEAMIKAACLKTEEFERYECYKRVNYAIEEEIKIKLQEKEEQRRELLELFQEDREAMINEHQEFMENFEKMMKCEYDNLLKETLRQNENNLKEQHKKEMCDLLAERNELLTTIVSMKEEFGNQIEQRKNEELGIIQQLFKQFRADVKVEKDKLMAQYTVELMHVVCAERFSAKEKDEQLKKECKAKIDTLYMEKEALLDFKPVLKECPNVPLWQQKCLEILRSYEQFAECVLKAKPGQGRFLIPLQQLLHNELSEAKHDSSLYHCCYQGGYLREQIQEQEKQKRQQPHHDGGHKEHKEQQEYQEHDQHQEHQETDQHHEHQGHSQLKPRENPKCKYLFLPSEQEIDNTCPFVIGVAEVKSAPEIESMDEKCSGSNISSFNSKPEQSSINLKSIDQIWTKNPTPPNDSEEDNTYNMRTLNKLPVMAGNRNSSQEEELDEMLSILDSDDVINYIDEQLQILLSDKADFADILHSILTYIIEVMYGKICHKLRRKRRRSNPSALLSAIDSIELIPKLSLRNAPSDEKNAHLDSTTSEESVATNSQIKCIKVEDDDDMVAQSQLAHTPMELTYEEYIRSLEKQPPYMLSRGQRTLSIWDYKPVGKEEWCSLIRYLEHRRAYEAAISHEKKVRVQKSSILPSAVSLTSINHVPTSILRHKTKLDQYGAYHSMAQFSSSFEGSFE